ncbi:MAG: ATPase [Spirochaetes bacterium]|nr:ATPase [Spirochaetota bacterium]
MSEQSYYAGVDIGSSRTKVVILNNEKEIVGFDVRHSGTDFTNTADLCLKAAVEMEEISKEDIKRTVSTGYGRKNVSYTNDTKTEIGCHAKGCYYYFPQEITIIDIGGQDNKIIKLNKEGKRVNFKMNRKCAAGTGAFLEEMSMRLDIPIEQMNELASQSEDMVKVGSFCTVFAATEVLENIRHGKKVTDIVKGLFFSVIQRVLEMDNLTENVVMTGGVVAHNLYLVKMAEEKLGRKILVPEYPQLTGAIGAALFAMEGENAAE